MGSNWFPCQLFSPSSLCLGEKAVQSHCYINFTIITHFDQVNTIFEIHYVIGSPGDTLVSKVISESLKLLKICSVFCQVSSDWRHVYSKSIQAN